MTNDPQDMLLGPVAEDVDSKQVLIELKQKNNKKKQQIQAMKQKLLNARRKSEAARAVEFMDKAKFKLKLQQEEHEF